MKKHWVSLNVKVYTLLEGAFFSDETRVDTALTQTKSSHPVPHKTKINQKILYKPLTPLTLTW